MPKAVQLSDADSVLSPFFSMFHLRETTRPPYDDNFVVKVPCVDTGNRVSVPAHAQCASAPYPVWFRWWLRSPHTKVPVHRIIPQPHAAQAAELPAPAE